MGKLFGTDGVRGVANTELTCELAYQLGRAGGYVLTKECDHKPRILVGMDTRISGDMLEGALVAGICSVGAQPVCCGVIPTPAVAYLVRKYGLDAGVMISASHNPVEYNGIKFFNSKGYKLADALEDEIEALIEAGMPGLPSPTGGLLGVRHEAEGALDDYVRFIVEACPEKLSGLKVVVDCANGAAYQAAPLALYELGAEVTAIHREPDGVNINAGCGSTHPEDLQQTVKALGADVGLAFDGDADRCLAVDEAGNLIDGDQIMAICGRAMKEKGLLKQDTIVGTVMSNLGFIQMGQREGIAVLQAPVGDRYVLEEMQKNGYNLGGEQSGHIIFLDHNTTGDGLMTAVQLLTVMRETGKPLSELAAVMEVLPQVLVNARVQNSRKKEFMNVPALKEAMEAVAERFAENGRVLIRPSGTEPLIRVMIEGKDLALMQQEADKLAALLEEYLG